MKGEDLVQDPFGGNDLIRAHHQQHIFGSEDAVTCQDVQDRMAGKKGLREICQVRNDPVVSVRPE